MIPPPAAPRLWVTDPEAYRSRLDALLGERDPLEVMAATAAALAEIAERHSAESMRARPFPGKWTPNEVIGHLVDAEWVYGFRMRLILCEDQPAIRGTEQEQWVERQRHNEREPKRLVETFRVLRECNLDGWRRLSPDQLSRVGQHNERGAESLGQLLRMIPGHDVSHLAQIQRTLEAGGS